MTILYRKLFTLAVLLASSVEICVAAAPEKIALPEHSTPREFSTFFSSASAEPSSIESLPGTLSWLEQKVVPSDGFGNGVSVAIAGNTAIIGAYQSDTNKGAAYVYARPTICGGSTCVWTLVQKITASDGVAQDFFGLAVAFDGTTALIGAPFADVGGHANQGAAYSFTKVGSTWTQGQKFVANDGAINDVFGHSVAISGNNALIGAPDAAVGGNSGQGAAYRFYKVGSNFVIAQKHVASDGGPFEEFGWSVGISGDTAIVGAERATTSGFFGIGAVYVFTQSCPVGGCLPAWPQVQRLVPTVISYDMNFGWSVAFEGTTLAVGAPYANVGVPPNQQIYQGTTYIFAKSGGTWSQTQTLIASNGHQKELFGYAVAISGSNLVVGASWQGWPSQTGAAYIFAKSGSTWTETTHFNASDATFSDGFGTSVGYAGNTVIVGSPQNPNQTGKGAAYFYTN